MTGKKYQIMLVFAVFFVPFAVQKPGHHTCKANALLPSYKLGFHGCFLLSAFVSRELVTICVSIDGCFKILVKWFQYLINLCGCQFFLLSCDFPFDEWFSIISWTFWILYFEALEFIWSFVYWAVPLEMSWWLARPIYSFPDKLCQYQK